MLIPVLLILSVLAVLASLAIGPAAIALSDMLAAMFGHGREEHEIILWDIRLPRTLLAFLIGATLAMSGAAMQGLVRNPLASPSLLGSSNFAALGAVVAIYFFAAHETPFIISLASIFMSMVSVLILLRISGNDERVITLILAGLALSSLASALIALALNFAPNVFAVTEITFWLLGSLSDRTFDQVFLVLPLFVLCWTILLYNRKALLALTLGEDVAQTLGVSIRRAKWQIAFAVALGIGAAVSVSGVIGFVGLIVPHLVRPFVGYNPARLLVPSAIAGGMLLVCADLLVKIIPSSTELKLGVVTSLIGVPFFLFLVLRERQGRPAFV